MKNRIGLLMLLDFAGRCVLFSSPSFCHTTLRGLSQVQRFCVMQMHLCYVMFALFCVEGRHTLCMSYLLSYATLPIITYIPS